MPRETVIDNETVSMWYYPEKKIVHHKVHQFIYGEDFYSFLLTGTELMKKHHANKWLSDDREIPVLRKEDADWCAVNWFPKTVEAGWKYWAIVQPEKVIGKKNIQDVVNTYSAMGITAKYFDTVEDAIKWLDEQKD